MPSIVRSVRSVFLPRCNLKRSSAERGCYSHIEHGCHAELFAWTGHMRWSDQQVHCSSIREICNPEIRDRLTSRNQRPIEAFHAKSGLCGHCGISWAFRLLIRKRDVCRCIGTGGLRAYRLVLRIVYDNGISDIHHIEDLCRGILRCVDAAV